MRLSLSEKLALPSPKWLLLGLIALVGIGIAKLLMWFVPLLAAVAIKAAMWIVPLVTSAVVKLVMWLAPIGWQVVIAFVAFACAVVTMAWRLHKHRKLYEDVMAGTTILFDAEYSVGE